MRRLDVGRMFLRQFVVVIAAWMTFSLAGCTSSTTPPMPVAAVAPRAKSPPAADTKPLPATDSENAAEADQEPVPAKTGRDPIYDPAADARADIKAALARATSGHKRVLVKFGGNWCGWCFKLHDVFKINPEIAPIIDKEYEVVLVDINTNQELLKEYDKDNQPHSYPWLTILDADGKVLVNQNTGDLEEGPNHDPAKVKAFLTKWQAK